MRDKEYLEGIKNIIGGWDKEGRTEEQIYGVKNFISSKWFRYAIEKTIQQTTIKVLKEVKKEIEGFYDQLYPESVFGKITDDKDGRDFLKGFATACRAINENIISDLIKKEKK